MDLFLVTDTNNKVVVVGTQPDLTNKALVTVALPFGMPLDFLSSQLMSLNNQARVTGASFANLVIKITLA